MIRDEEAQVHILEMLTLFWLFFMSATFLIRVHVPDAPSVAHDSSLEIAGDDAVRYALGLEAVVEGDSRLEELLDNGDLDDACTLLLDSMAIGKEANCWLTQNSGVATPYGRTGTPAGGTVTVHHLVVVDSDAWTVTLDVWARGGAA
jgi:hypothetical protein